ncbi:MAG: N-acetylmuramoyl-L-alanine amidase, partial [Pseudomonadota bacterium]
MRQVFFAALGVIWASCVLAQDFTGLARVDAARSFVEDRRGGAELRLGLSQPVPYRVFLLDDPWRLVLDFSV